HLLVAVKCWPLSSLSLEINIVVVSLQSSSVPQGSSPVKYKTCLVGLSTFTAEALSSKPSIHQSNHQLPQSIKTTLESGVNLHPDSQLSNGLVSSQPISNFTSVSPVQQVKKRIATKKLQRINGYESSSVPLNEDQKRAIASKPALEATIKELQDLLKILEDDEKLDELRIQAVREEEELKVQGRVDSAILNEQKKAQSDLALLLQFLHLYSLVSFANRPSDSFAPQIVPQIIQNATGQELAAVNTLFHRLADGPISGGGGDAFQNIQLFSNGSENPIIEGVTFARIKELVLDLTALPTDLPVSHQIQLNNQIVSDLSSKAEDQALPQSISPNMIFLQQSEVMPQQPISTAQTLDSLPDHVILPTQHEAFQSIVNDQDPSIHHMVQNNQLLETVAIVGGEELTSNNPNWSGAEQVVDSLPVVTNKDVQDVETQKVNSTENRSSIVPPPPPHHSSSEPFAPQSATQIGLSHHPINMNGNRGNYRGRGSGYRGGSGGPRAGGNSENYRGGRGWYRGGGGGGFRGGRGGPPSADMNGSVGWRPSPGGPPEGNPGYRPRGDYSGGRYGGHRGGSRGNSGFHRGHPSGPPPQVYHPEMTAPAGGGIY
ncbi:hypothetical protein O181_057099, partial [Austropuccinia psidii MF-1]|nr:hypothetical protein [Austropuccinia psidii MF-1]